MASYFKRRHVICGLLVAATLLLKPQIQLLVKRQLSWRPCQSDSRSAGRPGQHVMTVQQLGRLGNSMFQYAALRGLAARTGHRAVLSGSFVQLSRIFRLALPVSDSLLSGRRFVQHSEYFGRPDANLTIGNVTQLTGVDVLLSGYFESYLYFENVKDEIRREFTFRDDVIQRAARFLRRRLPAEVITVGVHVRIGDMTKVLGDKGWLLPPLTYFRHAIDYFRSRFGADKVYFVLCSDDKRWLEENLMTSETDADKMILSREDDGVSDLAILSSCDHVIISRGTFGWWAGWLVNGTTVYYRHYHPEGSLAALYHPPWSFIPRDEHSHWVAIE